MAETSGRTKGIGRIIVMVYAILALAASWRSGFQILSKFDDSPVAFILSGIAGLVYIVATIALATPGRRAWKVAVVSVWFELIGVLVVGAASLIAPEAFPEPTVWSTFGIGYGFIPLVLPIIGLYWLYRHRPKPIP
ncbi:MAG: hypothetical protein HLX51_11020 [Micrococcaceae bacterium]|nr:hypothetical protein [Micrococcaceae bacterium]